LEVTVFSHTGSPFLPLGASPFDFGPVPKKPETEINRNKTTVFNVETKQNRLKPQHWSKIITIKIAIKIAK
jgi:hypothetical protein